MHKKTISIIGALFALSLLGVGCLDSSTDPKTPIDRVSDNNDNIVVSNAYAAEATQTAYALLTPSDVWSVPALDEIAFPSMIEFNDHLDTSRTDVYTYYIARAWFDSTKDDNIQIENTINVYDSAVDAVTGLDQLTAQSAKITGSGPVGDVSYALFQPKSDGVSAAVFYRFQLDRYTAKVAVYDTDESSASEAELQAELEPQAYALAVLQAEKLEQLSAGTLDNSILYPDTYNLLPDAITGATLLGSTEVTETEWITVERNFSKDIPYLESTVMNRFQVNARPDEVIEIVVFNFFNSDYADSFTNEFIGAEDEELLLPYFLVDSSSAKYLPDGYGIELQGRYKNYVVDVTIMAPFGEFDTDAAITDLEQAADQVLTKIREQG